MNKTMLLPKPRTFSGIEQVNILVNMANYQHENTWLSAENKNLRKELGRLQELYEAQSEVHETLNQDYVELREQNNDLKVEISRLAHSRMELLNNSTKYLSALEYYANNENYKGIPLIKKAQVMMDNGEFARYVLDGDSQ